MTPTIDIYRVRSAARGRWHSILPALTGIDAALLDERNHPCVRCGGTDRMRCLDINEGAIYCNQCHREGCGDGFSSVMWLIDVPFSEALQMVAECVGLAERNGPATRRTVQMVATAAPVKEKKPAPAYATANEAIRVLLWMMAKNNMARAGQWAYCDSYGWPLAFVLRFNREDGTKEFRPVSKHGEWWYIKGPPIPRTLYGLEGAAEFDTIFVAEGEKAADACCQFAVHCVTSMNGSKSPEKTDWTPLRGKRVIILPDNDEPGIKYAMAVTTMLSGLNCDVRVVNLPRLPPGGDIADWNGTREELLNLSGMS